MIQKSSQGSFHSVFKKPHKILVFGRVKLIKLIKENLLLGDLLYYNLNLIIILMCE